MRRRERAAWARRVLLDATRQLLGASTLWGEVLRVQEPTYCVLDLPINKRLCRCVLDYMFDDQFCIKKDFLEQPGKLQRRECALARDKRLHSAPGRQSTRARAQDPKQGASGPVVQSARERRRRAFPHRELLRVCRLGASATPRDRLAPLATGHCLAPCSTAEHGRGTYRPDVLPPPPSWMFLPCRLAAAARRAAAGGAGQRRAVALPAHVPAALLLPAQRRALLPPPRRAVTPLSGAAGSAPFRAAIPFPPQRLGGAPFVREDGVRRSPRGFAAGCAAVMDTAPRCVCTLRAPRAPAGSAGSRRWSALARWRLREFNELPHYSNHRCARSGTRASATRPPPNRRPVSPPLAFAQRMTSSHPALSPLARGRL